MMILLLVSVILLAVAIALFAAMGIPCLVGWLVDMATEGIINVDEKSASVRDYGQCIPLGSVVKATCMLKNGGRFDDSVYKKSIGVNGVGTKAVNALSTDFYVYFNLVHILE